MTPMSTFTVYLDRIEEGIAILLAPDNFQWHILEEHLPEGVSEGMAIKVTMEKDQGTTEARIDRIRNLRDMLRDR